MHQVAGCMHQAEPMAWHTEGSGHRGPERTGPQRRCEIVSTVITLVETADVRYPLHDHVRHKYGWSNTHVLVRFMILQAVVTPLLLVLIFKVR